ncbi:MAG: RNA-binding domain-containing protein, partial [Candidatus Thermoplasmatota archaeon]|nr:RNA-binding domain-containing protein [Candidatus Thermoplasmatota archaeon]
VHKHRHIWLLIQNIFQNLSRRDVEKICKQRDSRLDDHGYLFIRLDKKLLLNAAYKLTEQGNCFHFKIKLASFPSTRENAMISLEELLEKMGCSVTE